MVIRTMKFALAAETAALFAGTVFAWSKLIRQFTSFYAQYGTVLRFDGTNIPNPLTTACLYGSLAFLVVLFWSVRIYQSPSTQGARHLRNFLLFCVCFAGSVVLYETAQYFKVLPVNALSISCVSGVSPLSTPCFTGMLFFIVAFLISVFVTRKLESATVS